MKQLELSPQIASLALNLYCALFATKLALPIILLLHQGRVAFNWSVSALGVNI
jgi:hypothetical protein